MSHLALKREFRVDDAESRVEVALRREFGRPMPGQDPAPEQDPMPEGPMPEDPMTGQKSVTEKRSVSESAESPKAADASPEREIAAPLTDVLSAAKAKRRRLCRALAAYDRFLFIASKLCSLDERERVELIFSDPKPAGQSGEGGKCSS